MVGGGLRQAAKKGEFELERFDSSPVPVEEIGLDEVMEDPVDAHELQGGAGPALP